MSEPTEIVAGEVSCACSIRDDPKDYLMLFIQSSNPNDPEPDVKIDAVSWFKELFAEHMSERFEIRFYETEASQ